MVQTFLNEFTQFNMKRYSKNDVVCQVKNRLPGRATSSEYAVARRRVLVVPGVRAMDFAAPSYYRTPESSVS